MAWKPTVEPNPIDYQAIRNVLANYCVALDTKNWSLLKQVFIDDVDADYPFSGPVRGCQTVSDGIQNRLKNITSQHALTTQTIEISSDGRSAKATTYFTGIHFGLGKRAGQQVTAYGNNVDELVIVDERPELPGASGTWRIQKRVLSYMGRVGEESVMQVGGE